MLRALRHPDFRLLWSGQFARGTGQWIQLTAVPLLILNLNGSALDLGMIAAAQFGPVLLIGPVSGVVADRSSKRIALMRIQTLLALQSIALLALAVTGTARIEYVVMLSAVFGLANAAEQPTRLSFVVDLVPPEEIANAVALQQTAFNATRMIGPALTGISIATAGFAATFALSAALALVTIALLRAIETSGAQAGTGGTGFARSLADGALAARDIAVRNTLLIVFGLCAFGLTVQTLMPLVAVQLLEMDPAGYGGLLASMGSGAVLGALLMTRLPPARIRETMAGALGCFSIGVASLTISGPDAAIVLAAAIGFVAITTSSSSIVNIQSHVTASAQGRVMGIYVAVYSGGIAVGSIALGILAEFVSVRASLLMCSVGLAITMFWCLWQVPTTRNITHTLPEYSVSETD